MKRTGKIIAELRAELRENRQDFDHWKAQYEEKADRLRDLLKRRMEELGAAAKANESLDAERNFLKARIETLELAVIVNARLLTEAMARGAAKHDWRTPLVENGCAKAPGYGAVEVVRGPEWTLRHPETAPMNGKAVVEDIFKRAAAVIRQPNNTSV